MDNPKFKKYEKQRLCKMFDLSATALRIILNIQYYHLLEPHGYKKTSKSLTPKQYKIFIDVYGEPI